MYKAIALLVFCVLLMSAAVADDSKPNIIVIVTDDQGYADLGCFGSKAISTPNVDRLAAAVSGSVGLERKDSRIYA